MPDKTEDIIRRHYARSGIADAIAAALQAGGKDLQRLTPADLAPVDQFHIRGRAATLELARAAGLNADMRVLDVGCGIGGTTRGLAAEFGCQVTGIDLTAEYCRVAEELSGWVGLAGRVEFHPADATRLPFADASFDLVWTEHVAMNIADKAALYAELHRVLKPGGSLAIYDVLAGPSGPVIFPVPWARTPEASFLATPEELRQLLHDAGFEIADWNDSTVPGRDWFVAVAGKMRERGLPPLGIHLLLGPEFMAMAQNQARNLQEGRIVLAQVVARKTLGPAG